MEIIYYVLIFCIILFTYFLIFWDVLLFLVFVSDSFGFLVYESVLFHHYSTDCSYRVFIQMHGKSVHNYFNRVIEEGKLFDVLNISNFFVGVVSRKEHDLGKNPRISRKRSVEFINY